MTVNKTLVAGAAVAAAGAGALAVCYYYCPWQTATAWSSGDEDRAAMLAESAFSLRDYAYLFVLLILCGLVVMAYASKAPTS